MTYYTIVKHGSPSLPIFLVFLDKEDENGYLIEHESVQVASFPTIQQAQEFANAQPKEVTLCQ